MTAENAIKSVFAAGAGGVLGWGLSECAKENIRERTITPKAADSIILISGLLGFFLARGEIIRFFFGGLAAIGFGRLLIQFEAGELESEGSQCPLGNLLRMVLLLPGPP